MRTHPCERIDPADVRVRKSGQQSATIHSPCWIRANDFVLFGHRRSCFGLGLADLPECSILQHLPQSRHVRFRVLREGFHATWAAQIDHSALVVDAGKTASSFHVLAADDAAWRFVLISDGVFEAHTISFLSSWVSKAGSKADSATGRLSRRRERHK